MKKIFICLIIGLLLFSGCSKEKTRNVELTDFTYTYSQNDNFGIIKITPLINIKNLSINYHLKSNGNILETSLTDCGDLKADREYSFLINSKLAIYSSYGSTIEVFSATGKVNNNETLTQREAKLSDIIISNSILTDSDCSYFLITPKLCIKDLFVTFSLQISNADNVPIIARSTVWLEWDFTIELEDVIFETQYRVKIPDIQLTNNYYYTIAGVKSITGTVKL